jgi:hypothetical protein
MNIHNDISFVDSVFAESEWQDNKFQYRINETSENCHFDTSGSVYLVTQVPEGGSQLERTCEGKPFRQLIQEWSCKQSTGKKIVNAIKSTTNLGSPERGVIAVYNMNRHAVINPKFIGGIKHLNFAVDLKSFEMMDNDSVVYSLIAQQDNHLFVCKNRAFILTKQISSWRRFTYKHISANDFVIIEQLMEEDKDLNQIQMQQESNTEKIITIDFSKNGSPIRFGYMTTSFTTRSKTQSITGIDNFVLTVRAGLDEDNSFSLCSALEVQHRKIKSLKEQLFNMSKQHTIDNKEIMELKSKLKLLEQCYNKLNRSVSMSASVFAEFQSQIVADNLVKTQECEDGFVQLTVVDDVSEKKSSSEKQYISVEDIDSISTSSSMSEKINNKDYGFSSNDIVIDEPESDLEDIGNFENIESNDPDVMDAKSSNITKSINTVSFLPSLKDIIPEKKTVSSFLEYLSPVRPNQQDNNSNTTNISNTSNNKKKSYVMQIADDDEWEIMENTRNKFTKQKILEPDNEI